MGTRLTALLAGPDSAELAAALGPNWEALVADMDLGAPNSAPNKVDLLLISSSLPSGGVDLVRALRNRVGVTVPTILVGESWDEDLLEVAVAAGAADLLVSPSAREVAARATLAVQRQRAERSDLLALANTDELTGLPNRRYLSARLPDAVQASRAQLSPLSILLLDIDRFKAINDAYGHSAGDRVLVEFAKVLRASSRATDVIGRWGGEEFLYILPGPLSSAEAQAERVRTAVASFPFGAPEFHLRLSVSIGATQLAESDNVLELIDRADRLLYQAKDAGRDGTVAG